jgi:hypothetical protein
VLRAAARRFLLLLALVGGASVLLGLAFGLLLGSSTNRSISLGLYLSGAFLLVGGFLLGNRGPMRRVGEAGGPMSFGRPLRRATPDEVRDSVNMTVLLVLLGFILLVIAVAVDSRYELV